MLLRLMSTQSSSPTPGLERLSQAAISRRPRQGRSLASFERMLAATRELMLERGSEEFTLQDVSERGNVSIGSIYLRFESKDRLLYAVIAQELQSVVEEEAAMVRSVADKCSNLKQFLAIYIDEYTAFMGEHAGMLRVIMQRASIDPLVSAPGKETAYRALAQTTEVMMTYRDEIRSENARLKAEMTLYLIYAAVARQLALGATRESEDPDVWVKLRPELAEMAYAYLKHSD